MVDWEAILVGLREEQKDIAEAIQALERMQSRTPRKRGRPRGSKKKAAAETEGGNDKES